MISRIYAARSICSPKLARSRLISTRATFSPPTATSSGSHRRVGVFFDSDNVSPRQYDSIVQHVREAYNPAPKIMRAYRDFGEGSWIAPCERLGIEPVHVARVPHKNSSDLYMTCDMMDLMHDLDTYVIVSNDSDFRHVMIFLRKNGKYTVGVTVNGGTQRLVPWSDAHLNIVSENKIRR